MKRKQILAVLGGYALVLSMPVCAREGGVCST